MVPDYDDTLLFPRAARSAVIEAFRSLCSGDSDAALADADQPRAVELAVSLRSWPDMPADVVNEVARLPDGSHALGDVYLDNARGHSAFKSTVGWASPTLHGAERWWAVPTLQLLDAAIGRNRES